MRPDLSQCTTECYRRGAGSIEQIYKLKFGGTVPIHPDPEHEYERERGGFHSSARHRHKEYKDFGDKLGALRGNLKVNVGRRWDDVFSEFCKHLDRRSINGHHIWTHLKYEVELNTMYLNGEVYSSTKQEGYRGDPLTGYYVHPITGILEYRSHEHSAWKRRWKKKKTPIEELQIPVPDTDDWKYCLIDGLWFRCKPVKEKRWVSRFKSEEIVFYNKKRSANKKEIAWIKKQLVELGY